MFCAPLPVPLPPDMPFGALSRRAAGALRRASRLRAIDWPRTRVVEGGKPFTRTRQVLAENGRTQDVIRLRNPGPRSA